MFRELISLTLALGIATTAYGFVWYVLALQDKSRPAINKTLWPLVLAVFLFIISRFLPELADVFNNRTTVQHIVGGGFVSTLCFWYIKSYLGRDWPFLLDLTILFAVVSSLGTTNEIIEASATWSGLYTVDGSDVWEDIFANSLGALGGYLLLHAGHSLLKQSKS